MSQSSTQSSSEIAQTVQGIGPTLLSPPGLLLLGCLAFLLYGVIAGQSQGKQKKVLARSALGGNKERTAARKLACQQIEQQVFNKFSLFIGIPKGTSTEVVNGKKAIYIPEDPRTIYLPNIQAGTAFFGAPETGKSFFGIDAMTRSAILQGISTIYYDFKGHEDPPPSGVIAAFAQEHGYRVSVFSPGSPETCVCNILDFLEHDHDAEAARDIAEVLNRNLKLSDSGSSGSYFTESGDQLAQAVLMLAKSSKMGDVMLCQKLLKVMGEKEDLVERLNNGLMNHWTKAAFDQYLGTTKSPETAASIASTASLLFNRFMVPSALSAFCGKTTLPLDIGRKQLIIFRMNPKNSTTVGPLLAAVLTMLVQRNIFKQRTSPLLLVLDEVKTIFLPKLSNWLNQMRSSGLGVVLAAQSLGVLEETYGKDAINSLVGGCATQIVFQLNDSYTAKFFSEAAGNEQIDYQQQSRSRGKGGTNNSVADHSQTRPLIEVNQLQRLPTGKALLLNRGYQDGKEVRIPLLVQLEIPQSEIDTINKSKVNWHQLQQRLTEQSTAIKPDENELEKRLLEAEAMLQLPSTREAYTNALEIAAAIK